MVLKFPSGRVSVSIRDLEENQHGQDSCGICNKLWVIKSDGCIKDQLHVLHPCQHLVGAGCWITVPDEQKDICPVCKVKIGCVESVRVYKAYDRVGIAFDKKMKEGLNSVDVAAIMYYMNLRNRLDSVKDRLGALLAFTQALTELHRERLVFFLAHAPHAETDSQERKIAIALYAFNISRGTKFTLGNLRMVVSSAEGWMKRHFEVILKDDVKLPEAV